MTKYYEVKVTEIIVGKNKTKKNVTEIERARRIKKSLGTQTAANYLRIRGWSIDATLYILTGK